MQDQGIRLAAVSADFNALMAVQMAGGKRTLRFGPCDPETFIPDLDWLQQELTGPSPPRAVYLVNPSNPSGGALSPTG